MKLKELLSTMPGLEPVLVLAEIGTGNAEVVQSCRKMSLDFSGVYNQGNISWKAQDMLEQDVIRIEASKFRFDSGCNTIEPVIGITITVDCTEIYTSKEDL